MAAILNEAKRYNEKSFDDKSNLERLDRSLYTSNCVNKSLSNFRLTLT